MFLDSKYHTKDSIGEATIPTPKRSALLSGVPEVRVYAEVVARGVDAMTVRSPRVEATRTHTRVSTRVGAFAVDALDDTHARPGAESG